MSNRTPPIPEPPRFAPDPRQQRASRVVSGFHTAEPEAGPAVRTGYPAAAVDLGALQRVIEEALADLEPVFMERWPEIEEWLGQCIRAWVQRCKSKSFSLRQRVIEIAVETQDDHGHYRYVFEVFSASRRC
jgi:hypothetical protein